MFPFGKKLFDLITPYHRVFLTIKFEREDNILTLPAKQTALFFLSNNDIILIDNMDNLDELVWLDYSLTNSKTGDPKFVNELDALKDIVKKRIANNDTLRIKIVNKIVYSKNCQIFSETIEI